MRGGRDRSSDRGVVGLGWCVVGLAVGLLFPTAVAASARHMGCGANQRVLEAAIAEYAQQFGAPPATAPGQLQPILLATKCLRQPVECPGPSYHFGSSRRRPGLMEILWPGAFAVSDPAATPPVYLVDANGRVECSFHGPADQIAQNAAIARERKLSPWVIRLAEMLNVPQPRADFIIWGGVPGALLLLLYWVRRKPGGTGRSPEPKDVAEVRGEPPAAA